MNFFPATDLNLQTHTPSEEDPDGVTFHHEAIKVEDGFRLLDGFGVPYSLSRTDIPLEQGYEVQKQGWDEGLMNSNSLLMFHPGKSDGGTNKERDQASSRRKGSYLVNDRRRRHRISERIVALQQLVPNSKGGGPSSAMDEITSYIQHLQLQLEDLSGSALEAKAVGGNNPLFFPQGLGLRNYTHGYGQNTTNPVRGPIGEVMGKLMEERPSLARKLLESKGLFLVPTTLAPQLGSVGSGSSSSSNIF